MKRPTNQKIIGYKWVFKRKLAIPGVEICRFLAKDVAKGFSQVNGINYHEIFSLVVKLSSIRLMLSTIVLFRVELKQLDVKTTFLHGNLEEQIYIEQLEGLGTKGMICLLKKLFMA